MILGRGDSLLGLYAGEGVLDFWDSAATEAKEETAPAEAVAVEEPVKEAAAPEPPKEYVYLRCDFSSLIITCVGSP